MADRVAVERDAAQRVEAARGRRSGRAARRARRSARPSGRCRRRSAGRVRRPASRTPRPRSRGLETGGSTGIGGQRRTRRRASPAATTSSQATIPKPTASCCGDRPPGQGTGRRRRRRRPPTTPAPGGRGRRAPGRGRLPFVGTGMRSGSELMRRLLVVIRRWRRPDRREGDRLDDLGVARAAAQVAGDRLADRRRRRVRHRRRDRPARPSACPGVQMPHCAPPVSRNAVWSGSSAPAARARGPRPCATAAPSTWQTGTRHESTGRPSSSTVHAPHSPSPQPSFVPVRRRSSRSDVEQPAHARAPRARPGPR